MSSLYIWMISKSHYCQRKHCSKRSC